MDSEVIGNNINAKAETESLRNAKTSGNVKTPEEVIQFFILWC